MKLTFHTYSGVLVRGCSKSYPCSRKNQDGQKMIFCEHCRKNSTITLEYGSILERFRDINLLFMSTVEIHMINIRERKLIVREDFFYTNFITNCKRTNLMILESAEHPWCSETKVWVYILKSCNRGWPLSLTYTLSCFFLAKSADHWLQSGHSFKKVRNFMSTGILNFTSCIRMICILHYSSRKWEYCYLAIILS